MARSVKKSKKKASMKASTTTDATQSSSTHKNQDQPTQTSRQEQEQDWTPLQQEQIDLAKKLDIYISEFQKKLLRLNFTPSPRELVILFIMNLHPRWRRLVEPVELSCSSWVEAAAFARLHCARVSAILGCEQNDADAIFKSPETRALRDSGYFAPESSPIAQQQEQRKNINVSDIMSSQEQHLVEKIISYREKSPPKPTTAALPESLSETSSSSSTTSQTVAKQQPSSEQTETKEPSRNATAKTEPETKKVEVKETEPSASTTAEPAASAIAPNSSSSSSLPLTKAAIQAKVQQAVKNRKEKEKDKKSKEKNVTMLQYESPFTATVDHEDPNSHSQSICNRVPPEHAGVNLAFLELTINEKKVKGLLAKLRWGSSAMSLDCVKRLGLAMRQSDHFGINTDFGYADSIGFLTLPIVHPADPNTKSEMEIQVLPQIYGGKIDLVLGADFFHYHNPTLNIRTRAIRFLEKETPYIVGQIE